MEAALKRQLVDLEDRYGKKCHVACSLGRRGDNLASELDKCMAKRDVAEHDAKRYKSKKLCRLVFAIIIALDFRKVQ